MKFLGLFLSIFLLQESYPPETQPIPAPELSFRALGFFIPESEPIEFVQGDVIEVDILVALASGTSTTNCQTGINQINSIAVNSAVATVQTVMIKCMSTTYISSGSTQTDLSRLYNRTDGYLDDVLIERDKVGADIVTLMVKSSDNCGIAFLNAFASSALAVVYDACMNNLSFAHEVGHIFGMAHDLPNAGAQGCTFGYGCGWCFGNGFKDALTYPSPCGGTRTGFYSNPNVIYQGKPTGTVTANNARVFITRGPIVANFRTRPEVTNHLRD